MHKIGTLHTHFYLDGLFIVTYHSDKRIGLKSIDTGLTRYIDHRLFLSQYTPLTSVVSNTWALACYIHSITRARWRIHSIHILHSQYCNHSMSPRVSPPHTHDAPSAWHIHSINAVNAHDALATKLPFHARETYLVPMGDGKYIPTKKHPVGKNFT